MEVETNERGTMKTIETGGIAGKTIAEMASEMIGEVDETDAAPQTITEVARVIGSTETIGKLHILCVATLLRVLTICSGVPVVGTSDPKSDKSPESKAKREAATADALAKAKAMVEAEQKKSARSETEAEAKEPAEKDNVAMDQEARSSELDRKASDINSKTEEVGVSVGKKRARDEDGEDGPEMKKVDTKKEVVETVDGES